MLPEESLFVSVATGLPVEQKHLFYGIGAAHDTAHVLYDRLYRAALSVDPATAHKPDEFLSRQCRIQMIADAWGVVDCAARLRRFFAALAPPREGGELEAFINETEGVRLLRNRGQHAEENITRGRFTDQIYPTLGGLLWWDTRGEHPFIVMTSLGVVTDRGLTPGVFQMPHGLREPIDKLQLSAFDVRIDLGGLVTSIQKLVASAEVSFRANLLEQIVAQGGTETDMQARDACDIQGTMRIQLDLVQSDDAGRGI